ncbi:ribosomal protein S18-alanine N-acetyltransferase [Paenibacillus turpanensis]|uniref:ribosomal protein S18-alanine N-acetyltransferase n=1 Tax=Paenibacillus turpanensis TaxID=2689078 RepID=UPI00140CDE69|nr:ribosomal protein S18-alanine N-acetyltransferase [Paenibacillus turpanensis]
MQEERLDVTFRAMRLGDIDEVCAIEQEAFTSPWSPSAFYNELTQNHFARYIVMEMGSMLIGYGGLWTIMDEAHITNIAVRDGFRGRKLGDRLLDELQRTAREYGMKRMTLEVRVSNLVAQSLYEKKGFRPAGLRKGYYSDNGEDALIMWADL